MQDQSIEAKQLYLRQNILDKGYDPQAFMGFCEQNQGHIDLQQWSMSKLIRIVQDYIKSKSEQTFTQQQLDNDEWTDYEVNDGENKQTNTITIPQNLQIKQEQIVFREQDWSIFGLEPPKNESKTKQVMTHQKKQKKMNTQNFDQFNMSVPNQNMTTKSLVKQQKQDVIQAPKIASTIQYKKQSANQIRKTGTLKIQFRKIKELPPLQPIKQIIIQKTQQKSKNFLKGQQTYYHIKIAPNGPTIQKRFSDFRKLKAIMHKLYPHIRLPYLEPQGWVNSSEGKDPEVLNKYKYQITQFLKYILITNDTLKKSKLVRMFTGLIQGQSTDIKKYESVSRPKKFLQLCLPGNQIIFDQYQSLVPIDRYMANNLSMISQIDSNYEKLRKALDTLSYNYDLVFKSISDVALIFQCLQNNISKFNIENDYHKQLRVYDGLKQVCLRMRQQMLVHQQVFRSKFYNFFKYQKDNMTTIKQINDIRSKMYSQYQKQNLNSSKKNQNTENTVIDGDMPIQQPCKNNKNVLRVQSMFWSHFSIDAVNKYWQQMRYKINEKLTTIAYDQLDNENQNLNFWNSVIKKCVI